MERVKDTDYIENPSIVRKKIKNDKIHVSKDTNDNDFIINEMKFLWNFMDFYWKYVCCK